MVDRDVDSVQRLLDFNDPRVALEVVSGWRRSLDEAVVVVDQLEELFTLSPPGEQVRFAALLGELVGTGGVRLVLAMRDDFLMHCHDHEALAPVFGCLVPLAEVLGLPIRWAFAVVSAVDLGKRKAIDGTSGKR